MNSSNPTFTAIRERRAARHFEAQDVPLQVLVELLELANTAPSGFNLQPWQFLIVRDKELKQLLRVVAMGQRQVSEAPAVVVFIADPEVWRTSYPRVLALGMQQKKMSRKHAEFYRRTVNLVFRTGPLNLFGLGKRIALPLRRFFRPTPTLVTSRQEAVHYVRSQTLLAAATFMIAAKSAGLETSPMEGFDEGRLKRLLAIPRGLTVPLIVAVGYSSPDGGEQSIRLPISEKAHLDIYGQRLPE